MHYENNKKHFKISLVLITLLMFFLLPQIQSNEIEDQKSISEARKNQIIENDLQDIFYSKIENQKNSKNTNQDQTETKFTIPKNLFDIEFFLYTNVLDDIEQLSGAATFENFGSTPTKVNYILILYNENMEKINLVQGELTVQTQDFVTLDFNEFKESELPEGKYTVVFSTIYNTDVKDIFIQDIYITKQITAVPTLFGYIFITFILTGLMSFGFFRFKTEKELKQENKKYKYKLKIPLFHRLTLRDYLKK